MAGIILSVDIGTSSLKAAIIDSGGSLLAFSRKLYPCGPNNGRGAPESGIIECGADAWEAAFSLALEDLCGLGKSRVIDAICISGNGPTLVPLTREGRALPPLYWYGKTSLPVSRGDAGSKGEPDCNVPGGSLKNEELSFFLPHAAWFKKNAPEAYSETGLFLSSHEWLAHRLGADPLTVLPHASYGPYFWDDEQCRLFDLESCKFPPFVLSGDLMGKVSASAAARHSRVSGNLLKTGTPIIAGGPDFITALLGTGTVYPSCVCDRAGSSEGINVCVSSPVMGNGLRVLPHAKEGLWNIGAVIESSGSLFEQYRAGTGQENRPYEEHLAELIPSMDYPEIFRSIGNSAFGNSGSALEKGRSVLCSIGFSVRRAIAALEERGLPVKEMRVSGGQGKNSRWNRLKADIAGVSLLVPEICDGELAGNAVIASSSLDCLSGPDQAAGKMIRFSEIYNPRPCNGSFWEELYALWCKENESI